MIYNIISIQFDTSDLMYKVLQKRYNQHKINQSELQYQHLSNLFHKSINKQHNNPQDTDHESDDDDDDDDDDLKKNIIYTTRKFYNKKNTTLLDGTICHGSRNMIDELQQWHESKIDLCNYYNHCFTIVNANLSRWGISSATIQPIVTNELLWQQYHKAKDQNKPANIGATSLSIKQIESQLYKPYKDYCVVSWIKLKELNTNTNDKSLWYEYKGSLYKCSSMAYVDEFLNKYSFYTQYQQYPLPNELPQRVYVHDCHKIQKIHCNLYGYCPVLYKDQLQLKDGQHYYTVVYKNQFYRCLNEINVKLFMKKPDYYALEHMPANQPATVRTMASKDLYQMGLLIAALEQDFSSVLSKCLSIISKKRLIYPKMTIQQSNSIHLFLLLKVYNTKLSLYNQKFYQKKLALFYHHCNLIKQLKDDNKEIQNELDQLIHSINKHQFNQHFKNNFLLQDE